MRLSLAVAVLLCSIVRWRRFRLWNRRRGLNSSAGTHDFARGEEWRVEGARCADQAPVAESGRQRGW